LIFILDATLTSWNVLYSDIVTLFLLELMSVSPSELVTTDRHTLYAELGRLLRSRNHQRKGNFCWWLFCCENLI